MHLWVAHTAQRQTDTGISWMAREKAERKRNILAERKRNIIVVASGVA